MNAIDRAAWIVSAIMAIAVGTKALRSVGRSSQASSAGTRAVAIDDGDLRLHVRHMRLDLGSDGLHLKSSSGTNLDIGSAGASVGRDGETPRGYPIRGCHHAQTCRLECETGGCEEACDRGTTCSAACEKGICTQVCEAGATCDFTCEGGHCLQIIRAGATSKTSCGGGGC